MLFSLVVRVRKQKSMRLHEDVTRHFVAPATESSPVTVPLFGHWAPGPLRDRVQGTAP